MLFSRKQYRFIGKSLALSSSVKICLGCVIYCFYFRFNILWLLFEVSLEGGLSIFWTALKPLIYSVLKSNADYSFYPFELHLQRAFWGGPHQNDISHVHRPPDPVRAQHAGGRLHRRGEVRREGQWLVGSRGGAGSCRYIYILIEGDWVKFTSENPKAADLRLRFLS